MIIMASASGTLVPAIARLVAADEDTVRDVIHLFTRRAWRRWTLSGREAVPASPDDDIQVIVTAARTRPEKLGQPFTRWSLRKLATYLADGPRPVRIGRERLRQLLHARGISFQRTRTWESIHRSGPGRQAGPDSVRDQAVPGPLVSFHQFGPLSSRPCHGTCWARRKHPVRLRANYHRTHGIRYFHGCYSLGDDQLWGVTREHKGAGDTLAALKSIRAARPGGYRLFVILDNLAANKTPAIRRRARRENVELCLTPTSASWANPIEAHFGPLRTFVIGTSDHPNHTALARKLQGYLRWRNAHARHPDVLAAQRRERARIRSERQQRWGRPRPKAA